jgi:TatD family hydrolase
MRCGELGHQAQICTADAAAAAAHAQTQAAAAPRVRAPVHHVPFIDTHCHIDYMCEAARVATWGEFTAMHPLPKTYAGCITTLCDTTALLSSFSQLDDLLASHANVWFTFGLHPHNSRYWDARVEQRLVELCSHPRCVGWGEIGIDATSEKKGGSAEDEQVVCFLRQLELAANFCADKAIQIHFRGDANTLLALLDGVPPAQKLHLHSWGVADVAVTKRLMDRFPNLYFGWTGVITVGSKLHRVVQAVPLTRFVLETDGPYLLPAALAPPKGQRILPPTNHPGHIPFIADAVAALHGVSVDRVLKHALANTRKLYGVGPPPSEDDE